MGTPLKVIPKLKFLIQRSEEFLFQSTIANLRENLVLNADFNSSFRAGEKEQRQQFELFSTPI